LALVGRKVLDRRMQGGLICRCLIRSKVRRIGQKGFMSRRLLAEYLAAGGFIDFLLMPAELPVLPASPEVVS